MASREMRGRRAKNLATALGFPPAFLFCLTANNLMGFFVRLEAGAFAGISLHTVTYALLGLICFSIGVVFQRCWNPSASASGAPFDRFPFAQIDMVALASLGSGLAVVCLADTSSLTMALANLLACLGFAWLDLRWGTALSRLSTEALMRAVMCAMIFSAVLSPIASYVSSLGDIPALTTTIVIATASATALSLVPKEGMKTCPGAESRDSFSETLYHKGQISGFVGIMVGVIAYSLVFMLRGKLDYGYERLIGIVPSVLEIIVVISIFIIVNKDKYNIDFYLLLRITFIIFATCVLVAPLSSGVPEYLVDGFMAMVVKVLTPLLLMLCAYVSRHSDYHPFLVFGLFYGLYGIPRLLEPAFDAIASVGYLGGGPEGFYHATILFLISVGLAFSLVRTAPGMAPVFGDYFSPNLHGARTDMTNLAKSADSDAFIDRRFAAISEAYGLTDREAEVMKLMSHGRSKSYIADTMYVSENTVKAYSKSLYVKLDIHSKQELIDLVEGFKPKG